MCRVAQRRLPYRGDRSRAMLLLSRQQEASFYATFVFPHSDKGVS